MQAFLSQNLGYTRNEMILEESLYESEIGRLLSQHRAMRAARISRLQAVLASLFGRNNTRGTHRAITPQGEQTHTVI
jgi:hypothetical protein